MKTLIFAPFSTSGLAALRDLGDIVYEPWTDTQEIQDPEELGQRIAADGVDALVVEIDFLFEELFDAAPGLRFAAICRSALNQVDLEAATDRGVVIAHTPGRNAQAVAELVLGHLLSLARHIPQASAFVANGQWEDPTEPYTRFQGREVAGATLGLVGLGQIGGRVARLARGVGMRVQAYDPYVSPGTRAAAGVTLVDLNTLLATSDFVSIHVPETIETTGMLDGEALAKMRPNAYLVNVTSPTIVDRDALVNALRTGKLAGAAMDVHDSHPLAPDSPFIDMPNVLLTPHIGGATRETIERHSAMVAEDLRRFARGAKPKHLANPDVWARRRKP
ncbi:MAG: hydroxyacid dehydrogenase [Chloroflexi bacterium]|nr:hydroxyacid dehydrogenase [Chloroflexota bacterium]